ncbi:MAG: hypothetical protein ABJF23_05100 [Bryobacteraceae bacterium]
MKILFLFALFLSLLPAEEPVAEKPASAPESMVNGSVDVGYRWVSDPAGSFNTYRSIVNLGSGLKLLGAEFSIVDPKKRFFDRIDTRAYSWGDDPYTTLHVNARKQRLYDFNADYRDIAYFNAMPSFANPLLTRGSLLNQRSFDTQRRFSSFDLDIFPSRTIVPYLSYGRSSGSGNGVTTFVTSGNEYAVPDHVRDSMEDFRGGVRFEYRRVHFNLEQGGTRFKDDQQLYSSGNVNTGNRNTPFLGQTLLLKNLLQSYGVRGTSVYSKAMVTANPVSWMDVSGQLLYSQPQTDVNYQQANTGNFVDLGNLLFYTSQQYLLSATAKLPRTSGNVGVEIRPFRRVRILESWLTDRLHTASSTAFPVQTARLVTNYSQQEIDVLVDVTTKLTVRGGYRYVWGDAGSFVLPLTGLNAIDSGKLERHVGIAGISFRPGSKISMSGEFEGSSGGSSYFRTSLNNYTRMHARGQYQMLSTLLLAADFSLLTNQNPAAGTQYDYLARQSSLSLHWTPKALKFSIDGDYTRSTMRSDIFYLIPQTLTPEQSLYRDNAHLLTALLNVPLPSYRGQTAKLTAGGSFAISAGSRPTNYFQPLIGLYAPVTKKLMWVSQWRYYGYSESFYAYEGFRTHILTTGLRFSR